MTFLTIIPINKFFLEFMEKISEKIYLEIILIKEGKNHSFSKSKVKDSIEKTIKELIDIYIHYISESSMGGMYEKYNLNEKDKIACEKYAKKIGDSSAEKIYLRYCDLFKNNRNSFLTLLFAFIAVFIAVFIAALPVLKGIVIYFGLNIDSFKHFFSIFSSIFHK